MKNIVLLLCLVVLLTGCGTPNLMVDKSDGISKAESRILAKQYMGGMEPAGFFEAYDTWRWDFRVKRPGYETTLKHVYVNKITGNVAEGIR